MIGFEGAAGGGVRRTTPAARRRVPQGPLAVPARARPPSPASTRPPWSRRSSASRWSPSATPRCGWFSDGVVTLEAGSGDEAQASEALEAHRRRRGHLDRVQPAVPARRARRARGRRSSARVHPGVQAGRDARRQQPGRRRRRAYRYLLMPVRLLGLSAARRDVARALGRAAPAVGRTARLGRSAHGDRSRSVSARWAATCASGCAAPGTPSSATTATPTSVTSTASRSWSRQLPAPKVVWVMVPAGDPTRETVDALAELLGEGDVVVDGGNSR